MRTSEQARRLRSTWWRPPSLNSGPAKADTGAYLRWIQAKYSFATVAEAQAYVDRTQYHCHLISVTHDRSAPPDEPETRKAGARPAAPQDPLPRLLRAVSRLTKPGDLHQVLRAVELRWERLNPV